MHNNLSIIGAGNLANSLVPSLLKAGLQIDFIYSKNGQSAHQLAKKYRIKATSDIKKIKSDIIIIATTDSSIKTVSESLQLSKDQIVLHTAGSISINVLTQSHKNAGVLYPLQTFTRNKEVDLKNVPFCIEASNKNTYSQVKELAELLSNNITELTSEQRLALHTAAVFTNNFTNLMYTIGNDILTSHNIDFNLLRPLISETAKKAISNQPEKIQTGPALRDDIKTIQAHKDMLKGEQLEMYELLTKWIKNRHRDMDKA
ncbi:MAG: DUF2520 domain-containing protein [Salinivirgaceae bacterium]|nr:MAG: DUF2520 domain-containing protein [Salinivirgaceae bacterium]